MRALLAALLLFAFSLPALATERITRFVSDITVASNGEMTVRETIEVVAESRQINHGIFRDLPNGRYDVTSVKLDGASEPYKLQRANGANRIRIGNADTLVAKGNHVYEIAYRTSRQIRFFERYDELYWSVTGEGWAFPIDRAEAIVHLPPGATISQSAFYTGSRGSTAHDGLATGRGPSEVEFATTRPLAPRQGLTIAIGFNKGAVQPPTAFGRATEVFQDNGAVSMLLSMVALLAAYYVVVWWYVGRDPARGAIVSRFEPPRNLSAAAVGFLYRMRYDNKVFVATLVAMAVKGYIAISQAGKVYTLKRTGTSEDEARLSPAERAVAQALLVGDGETTLRPENAAKISSAISALSGLLKRGGEGSYFTPNTGWWWGGWIIIAMTVVVLIVLGGASLNPLLVPLGFFGIVTQAIIAVVFLKLLKAPTPEGAKIRAEVEGFRQFLVKRQQNHPQMNPPMFEKFLPYAIALDVENAWSKRFEADAVAGGYTAYTDDVRPSWYYGHGYPVWAMLSSDLGSSIQSTQVSVSSSSSFSGSDGGGFSGGGDGGGGGGGW